MASRASADGEPRRAAPRISSKRGTAPGAARGADGAPGGVSSKHVVPSVRRGPLPSASTVLRVNDLALPHVESYNMMLDTGLRAAVADLPAREVTLSTGQTLHLWIQDVRVGTPLKHEGSSSDKRPLMPSECREAGLTYAAPMVATFGYKVCEDASPAARAAAASETLEMRVGDLPIMVRSSHCLLAGMGPAELLQAGEEAVEFGGYFICNGNERVIRMLQLPKRNFPMAITRRAYTNRGPLYSDKGIVIRCMRKDQSGVTLTMHYLTDGSATVRFAMRRQEFFLPIIMILKALVPCTDREIYERVLAGDVGNTYLSDRLLMLLADAKRYEAVLHDQTTVLSFLGSRFRSILDMPASLSDADAGRRLLDRFILIHIPPSAARDKFNLLILMLRKLYLFVRGDVQDDSQDVLANHELLLSGHLILSFVKEKFEELLSAVDSSIRRDEAITLANAKRAAEAAATGTAVGRGPSAARAPSFHDDTYLRKTLEKQADIGRKVNYLLATGNLITSTGLDLMQVSGFTVVADKINYMRFTTHFRSVHRGAFFATMKTTAVRKLLPENWGFLCPVHTPDGAPCGLLNHLAAPCSVVAKEIDDDAYHACATRIAALAGAAASPLLTRVAAEALPLPRAVLEYVISLGITPAAEATVMSATHLPVMLDGRLIGWADPHTVFRASLALRRAKALSSAIRAGLDRVGAGELPGQRAETCELVRSAVLGLTDHRTLPARRSLLQTRALNNIKQLTAKFGEGVKVADTWHAEEVAVESSPRPDGIFPAVVLPPAMEVAFIPPSWWDPELDPFLEGDAAAERAARSLTVDPATAAASTALTGAASAGDRSRADSVSSASSSSSSSGSDAGASGSSGSSDSSSSSGSSSSSDSGSATATPAAPKSSVQKLTGLYPGLFMHTTAARLVRPVLQLDTGLVELICPLEQPYMDIACTPEDLTQILHRDEEDADAPPVRSASGERPLLYTHIELSPLAMLSEVASFIPFSDLNQSPRNMYQCQMGKQTMGTPLHSFTHRTDSKLFRLQNPQAPVVHNASHAEFGMDEYPSGANAVVAVIAYTGYDMEDACIVNKSSYERGFGHASVYKTLQIDLQKDKPMSEGARYVFHNTLKQGERLDTRGAGKSGPIARPLPPSEVGSLVFPTIDMDGLPAPGTLLRHGDPLYVVLDTVNTRHDVVRHKETEPAYVDEVRVLPPRADRNADGPQRVSIKLRMNRNPIVGDKFSSRHGQKGVLSFLWPQEDMPFSDSGMTPDVIINPHAFPSRMTIGMLVESMAGKSGALHGAFADASPFQFNESRRAVDYFGEQLRAAGYAYYGTETMYSGVTGEALHCDIYLGVVYYQRLRHMVSDKSQARATGPVNNLTRQPVKGRKKHGGIRFGEMERDSLLAHGASFLLHDRLHTSSDRHIALVCKACGSLLSPMTMPAHSTRVYADGMQRPVTAEEMLPADGASSALDPQALRNATLRSRRTPWCRACESGEHCVPIPMPYVFRYLVNELAAMNIKIKLEVGEGPYGVEQPAAAEDGFSGR